MGAMSTMETLLLVGGGALVLYLVMKNKATTPTTTTVYVPTGSGSTVLNPNTVAADATSVANSILNLFN